MLQWLSTGRPVNTNSLRIACVKGAYKKEGYPTNSRGWMKTMEERLDKVELHVAKAKAVSHHHKGFQTNLKRQSEESTRQAVQLGRLDLRIRELEMRLSNRKPRWLRFFFGEG